MLVYPELGMDQVTFALAGDAACAASVLRRGVIR